eukprot:PhF_6_TR30599/c0_g1_i1/m.45036
MWKPYGMGVFVSETSHVRWVSPATLSMWIAVPVGLINHPGHVVNSPSDTDNSLLVADQLKCQIVIVRPGSNKLTAWLGVASRCVGGIGNVIRTSATANRPSHLTVSGRRNAKVMNFIDGVFIMAVSIKSGFTTKVLNGSRIIQSFSMTRYPTAFVLWAYSDCLSVVDVFRGQTSQMGTIGGGACDVRRVESFPPLFGVFSGCQQRNLFVCDGRTNRVALYDMNALTVVKSSVEVSSPSEGVLFQSTLIVLSNVTNIMHKISNPENDEVEIGFTEECTSTATYSSDKGLRINSVSESVERSAEMLRKVTTGVEYHSMTKVTVSERPTEGTIYHRPESPTETHKTPTKSQSTTDPMSFRLLSLFTQCDGEVVQNIGCEFYVTVPWEGKWIWTESIFLIQPIISPEVKSALGILVVTRVSNFVAKFRVGPNTNFVLKAPKNFSVTINSASFVPRAPSSNILQIQVSSVDAGGIRTNVMVYNVLSYGVVIFGAPLTLCVLPLRISTLLMRQQCGSITPTEYDYLMNPIQFSFNGQSHYGALVGLCITVPAFFLAQLIFSCLLFGIATNGLCSSSTQRPLRYYMDVVNFPRSGYAFASMGYLSMMNCFVHVVLVETDNNFSIPIAIAVFITALTVVILVSRSPPEHYLRKDFTKEKHWYITVDCVLGTLMACSTASVSCSSGLVASTLLNLIDLILIAIMRPYTESYVLATKIVTCVATACMSALRLIGHPLDNLHIMAIVYSSTIFSGGIVWPQIQKFLSKEKEIPIALEPEEKNEYIPPPPLVEDLQDLPREVFVARKPPKTFFYDFEKYPVKARCC